MIIDDRKKNGRLRELLAAQETDLRKLDKHRSLRSALSEETFREIENGLTAAIENRAGELSVLEAWKAGLLADLTASLLRCRQRLDMIDADYDSLVNSAPGNAPGRRKKIKQCRVDAKFLTKRFLSYADDIAELACDENIPGVELRYTPKSLMNRRAAKGVRTRIGTKRVLAPVAVILFAIIAILAVGGVFAIVGLNARGKGIQESVPSNERVVAELLVEVDADISEGTASKALERLMDAYGKDRGNAAIAETLSAVYILEGDLPRASEVLRDIHEEDPGNIEAAQLLNLLIGE